MIERSSPSPPASSPLSSCWRTSSAQRATLLIDADEYFCALRSALLQARHHVVIAGWDFDSRIHLRPRPGIAQGEYETAPTELAELLGYLVRTRLGLQVHVIRWDYHWMYRDDREPDTRERLERVGVHFHADGSHIITGCVHHKVVVIDDALAFCGGIDLTHKRWDTSAHDPQCPGRCDAHAGEYMPVHDTQLCVSGRVAADLGDYLRENWPSEGPPPPRVPEDGDLWPRGVRVDFENIPAGIARTRPPTRERPGVREIEALYLAAIGNTRRTLYFENQYFTSTRIARAIAEQCRREPMLEGLLVGMERPKTPVELHTMGYGLTQFHDVLVRHGLCERIPLVAALCGESQSINMHSKLALFDDEWLTVGSANLNRRSMGFDVECNVVLESRAEAHRERMRQLRHRLLGEHLSMEPEEVETAVRGHGLARLPQSARRTRRLVPLRPDQLDPRLGPILAPLFDRDERLPLPAPATRARQRSAIAALRLGGVATLAMLSGSIVGNDSLQADLHANPCAERRSGAIEARICEVLEHFVRLTE